MFSLTRSHSVFFYSFVFLSSVCLLCFRSFLLLSGFYFYWFIFYFVFVFFLSVFISLFLFRLSFYFCCLFRPVFVLPLIHYSIAFITITNHTLHVHSNGLRVSIRNFYRVYMRKLLDAWAVIYVVIYFTWYLSNSFIVFLIREKYSRSNQFLFNLFSYI